MVSYKLVQAPCWWLAGLFLLMLGLFSQAADNNPDGLLLKEFPGASIETQTQSQANDYMVALSNYRKIQGLWQVEGLRLSGQLQRTTYRLPDNHTAHDGFLFFTHQLQQYPVRDLYVCQSRGCESSSRWASNHFNVLQLYGSDQHQYYGAYQVTPTEGRSAYVTVYAVLRGNKRVYVQVEILTTEDDAEPVS